MRLFDEGIDCVWEIGVHREHIVILPDAQDFVIRKAFFRRRLGILHELGKHFQQRNIETLKLMAHETAVPEPHLDLVCRGAMLDGGVGVVFHRRNRLLNQRDLQGAG